MLRQTISRTSPALGFVLALLFTPHCTAERTPEADPTNEVSADGVVLSAASWSVDWNTDGVDFDPAGGWSITTNLDYRLHITTGHFVLHRVALVPCPAKPSETAALLGLSISSAFAHEETGDPSSMETLSVFDLTQPVGREIGANAFAPARYCQVYWLIARGMKGATSSGDFDMSNRSVYFEGTWERGAEKGPLFIDTWWPMGTFADLETVIDPKVLAEVKKDENAHFAFVTLDMPMGRLFDDIDFAVDSEAIVADTLLDNCISSARVTALVKTP